MLELHHLLFKFLYLSKNKLMVNLPNLLALIESTTGAVRPTFLLDCFFRGNHYGYQWYYNTEKTED